MFPSIIKPLAIVGLWALAAIAQVSDYPPIVQPLTAEPANTAFVGIGEEEGPSLQLAKSVVGQNLDHAAGGDRCAASSAFGHMFNIPSGGFSLRKRVNGQSIVTKPFTIDRRELISEYRYFAITGCDLTNGKGINFERIQTQPQHHRDWGLL